MSSALADASSAPLAPSIEQQPNPQQVQRLLPLVELKGPVFQSGNVWQPGRSLEAIPEKSAAVYGGQRQQQHAGVNAGSRTRDLLIPHQPQVASPRAAEAKRLLSHHHHLLYREASQITMATAAAHAAANSRGQRAQSDTIELDGRHLSAVGQRRAQQQQQQQQQSSQSQCSTPESTPAESASGTASLNLNYITSGPAPTMTVCSVPASSLQLRLQKSPKEAPNAAADGSLPFMRRHLRRHRTLRELTLGQDRLVVDAFAETPSFAERIAGRMRACAGEPTPGQAKILQRQRQQSLTDSSQQAAQVGRRPRISRREKTAQTIGRAILTYDRSL